MTVVLATIGARGRSQGSPVAKEDTVRHHSDQRPPSPTPNLFNRSIDDTTRERLTTFLADVRTLRNESAKSHRFLALVEELFPQSAVAARVSENMEKVVRVRTADRGEARRRLDAYYGSAIIEFENSLRRTEAHAHKQLREQAAGVWNEDGSADRGLLCIATDGVEWQVLRPSTVQGSTLPLAETNVRLSPLRSFKLAPDTLGEFWYLLTGLLFREHGVAPTAQRFTADFGALSAAFDDALTKLAAAWEPVRDEPTFDLLFDTWLRYLTVTYGSVPSGSGRQGELTTLFLKHTYLATLARLLVWAALTGGQTKENVGTKETLRAILDGTEFQRLGIANLVETDFFRWISEERLIDELGPVWLRLLDQILTYDLNKFNQDVLKGVYQELVDPADRHELGEYYTPDWLAEITFDRTIERSECNVADARVLDPACGSGTFLRTAIARKRETSGDDPATLQSILSTVVGIDIHPLAVTIAKATYLLALGPLIRERRGPIALPVYLADTLFLPKEVQQYSLGSIPGVEVSFGDRSVVLPDVLLDHPDRFDQAIARATDIAIDHAAKGAESAATLQAFIASRAPKVLDVSNVPEVTAALWDFAEQLSELIRAGRDSIWSFVLRNQYRPAMLKGHFDVIVGNPPWLVYRSITDPAYQRRIKEMAVGRYGVCPPKKKLYTHMELASVFLVHSLDRLGAEGAQLGFVMPLSVLSADQHEKLRLRTYVAQARIEEIWDFRDVRPLFRVPSCVVFAERATITHSPSFTIPMQEWKGRLPQKDLTWKEAAPHLDAAASVGRLIFLGERSAISTTPGSSKPNRSSYYQGHFTQGATIFPRSAYFVTVQRSLAEIDPKAVYWAETEPEQAKLAKGKYASLHVEGDVEGRFLFATAISDNVLPFFLKEPRLVVLPLLQESDSYRIPTTSELRSEGYRGVADWMEVVQEEWNQRRGRKASKMSAMERLDYQRGMTRQSPERRDLVLFNASGTDMSAARVDTGALPLRFIVESKLYWMEVTDTNEARFVVGVLNSTAVNTRIKPFQSVGLQGQRDIHTKPLDLPIPRFDDTNATHAAVVDACAAAEKAVAASAAAIEAEGTLARQRSAARKVAAPWRNVIDEAVEEILSD